MVQQKIKTHIIVSSFLAFLLLCAVGVLFAVWFHSEPTFSEKGAVWNGADFPLGVCVKPYEPSAKATKSAEQDAKSAIDAINARLDFYALSYRGENDSDCVVFGTLGVPVESGWIDPGGHAKWQPYVNCEFRTANPPPGTEVLIIEHEIGHCLGLDHDQYQSSIMYYGIQGPDPTNLNAGITTGFPPEISDDDKNAIRSRYLKQK